MSTSEYGLSKFYSQAAMHPFLGTRYLGRVGMDEVVYKRLT